MSKTKMTLLIFGVSLIAYLLFNTRIPITDPVESNYALTAKEMVLSGNWLSPQIYGHYWYDKPIFIYWLLAGSFKIFGICDFAARIPAALFGALSVTALFRFVSALAGLRQALFSALILATSLEFFILSKMVLTDMVLFFFFSVSLGWFYLALNGCSRYGYVLAFAAAGFAVLTKGPVGIVLPGFILLLYLGLRRDFSGLRHLFWGWGFLIFFAIAVPWYYLMYAAHGQDFVNSFFGLNNYLRATVSEHPKDNVFYYYFVLVPLSFLPWTGLLIPALWQALRGGGRNSLFYLIWFGGVVGFYTFMATKYPTYAFPAAFPAAVLSGAYLETMFRRPQGRGWLVITLPAVLFLLLLAAATDFLPDSVNGLWCGGGCLLAACLLLWAHFSLSRNALVVLTSVSALCGLLLITSGTLIPLAQHRSAQGAVRYVPVEARVGIFGEYETSAVYYGRGVWPRLTGDREANQKQGVWAGKYTMPVQTVTDFLQDNDGQPIYILMKQKEEASFTALPAARGFQKIAESNDTSIFKSKE